MDTLKISNDAKRKCSVALVEAVDNAVFHSHGGIKSYPIEIKISCLGRKTVMEVKDMGKGFDIKKVPEPSLYQINGRGIFIVKRLMKNVEYTKNTLKVTYEERN